MTVITFYNNSLVHYGYFGCTFVHSCVAFAVLLRIYDTRGYLIFVAVPMFVNVANPVGVLLELDAMEL